MARDPIRSARSLESLLAAVRAYVPARDANDDEVPLDLTDLPTFGGRAPRDTAGVWSWDRTRVLVGTCIGDMRIEPRRPAGRPPVTGTTRDASVLVRLSREEKRRLEEAAKRSGLGLGPWLRSLGLREAGRR